jgi:hypothetical protein
MSKHDNDKGKGKDEQREAVNIAEGNATVGRQVGRVNIAAGNAVVGSQIGGRSKGSGGDAR